ncbi:MAG TPA: FAD-dependent oxidoreductase [Polyangiaceae bacterium]|jgi:glutamate synthase (NADPH/NADH) small chain
MAWIEKLPGERAETALADKKPLMDAAEARLEAERCLYCADAPCTIACPTSIDVPGFIKRIASGNVRGSARTILEQNILGYSCARVCPVEVLCEGSCVYTAWQHKPIAIGRLQRFATETATKDLREPVFTPKAATGKRVACIGAGPASLAFAAYLALEGHHATIFEKRALPGGLNTTGVAPYKLHADDALREVEWVKSLGVEIKAGVEVGRDVTGAQLLAENDAVFLGLGLGEDTRLGVPGEEGPGVVGATAWIEGMKLANGARPKLGRVVVVGGGNTAIDVARECAQLGAEDVLMVYRRGPEDMSGYAHELEGAKKDGVRVMFHVAPARIERDAAGAVKALHVSATRDGAPFDGAAVTALSCDLVALAIGQSKLRSVASQFPGVALDRRGCVVADPSTGVTGNPKVFSGGDCVNGGKEVVNAVADGRDAARHLHGKWSHG